MKMIRNGENDKIMERNHYPSSKTIVIVPQIFRKKQTKQFFSFQKPCNPWQFSKLFSRKTKTRGKELLPSGLPEVAPRTTSTVGLSDMMTKGSETTK